MLKPSVQLLSCVWLFVTQHTRLPCPSPTPGDYSNASSLRQWCHPTISSSVVPFSSCPQSFPASGSFFSNELFLHISWPKHWSFSFSMSPSNEYSGLISFRMDWLDLLAVQRTHKNLLQQHKSKASILQCSAFFIVQTWHAVIHGVAKSRHNWATELILFSIVAARIFQHCPRIPFFPHPYQHLLLSFWQ